MSLKTPVNYGVDDNFIPEEIEFIPIGSLGEVESLGDFQIFMLRDDEPSIYPEDAPEVIRVEYDLADELDFS